MNITPLNFNSFLGISKNLKDVDLRHIEYTDVPVDISEFKQLGYDSWDFQTSVETFRHALKLKKDEEGFPKSRQFYLFSVYDLPIGFALEVFDRAKMGEDVHITEKTPSMFYGIEKKELFETLDIISSFIDDDVDDIKFEIDEKEFELEQVSIEGRYGITYKLTSEGHKPLLFKAYRTPNEIGIHGALGEIALERELNRAGVIDVPDFYMASPLGKTIKFEGDKKERVYASWKISEFVDENTPLKDGTLTLEKYLKKKRLKYDDMHKSNKIGAYFVDLGGVINKDLNGKYEVYDMKNLHWLHYRIAQGKSSKEILKEMRGKRYPDIF